MASRIFADFICPDGIRPDSTLTIDDNGVIESIASGRMGQIDYDFAGCTVVPGFIDVHVHGGGGADFMDGTVDSVRTALRTHAKFGTTSLLATTLTASRADIDKAITAIKTVMDSPGEGEARIAGIHLEGPYICAQKRGAQPLAPIRQADTAELAHWIELSGKSVKLITIAPEQAPDGGKEFIEFARKNGVVVSIGHTNATFEQAIFAEHCGVTHATHLFNVMPPLLHREPGVVGCALASDTISVELIADGVHVHPAIASIVFQAVGHGRLILITDAISGLDQPDGTYSLGGQDVIVSNGTAKFADGTLAGSVLSMSKAFANIQKFTGCDAVEASSMASANAARQLQIGPQTGSIEVGKQADFAVLQPDSFDCVATMIAGEIIWRA